jgi:hypothetical protein
LAEAPELQPLRGHFEIGDGQLKNHIRCVALSRDNQRYLFTAVDEAWCVDSAGAALWGVKLPPKEGWKRVATPSDRYGTSWEIQRALTLRTCRSRSEPTRPSGVIGSWRCNGIRTTTMGSCKLTCK